MNTTYFLNTVAGNLFLSDTSAKLPTAYYIGLSTTPPNVGGTGVTEPASSAGYARVRITGLSAPASGAVSNTANIDFPESTNDWGTITHFVIFDAATAGHLLMYGALSRSRQIDEGSVLTIRTGDLDLCVFNGDIGN